MSLSIIVAVSDNGVIGQNNKLPWHVPEDLKFFKKTTKGHAVIMGRKTYESIGRPLPKRTNLVITRQQNYEAPGCLVCSNLEEAISLAYQSDPEPFVIGGSSIYEEAFKSVSTIYYTRIKGNYEGDSTFPQISWQDWNKECLGETEKAVFFKLTRQLKDVTS